jgi:voltage-gated potassium channel
MTIITITTVGYGEVHPLSTSGQMFASVLIISSFGFFALAITNLSGYVFSGEYQLRLRKFKLIRKITKMNGHIVVCGYGRVGRQVVNDMINHDLSVVVIESDDALIPSEKNDHVFFIKGDATLDSKLEQANVKKASVLVTCLPKDTDNVYVVLAARELNADIKILSRASNEAAIKKLRIAGAHHVIMPDSIGGAHMASLITNPDVIEFIEAIRVQGKSGVNMESIPCDSLSADLMNKPISSLEINQRTGATIIGIKTSSGKFIINPDNTQLIAANSSLIVIGTQDQIVALNNYLGI